VIKSWRDKRTEQLFKLVTSKGFPAELVRVAKRRLDAIAAAETLGQLGAIPGNDLHPLSGDRAGQYAIRINKQWRVCFVWADGHAWDVEVTDYH
jgi:proteic killer suppression protein